MSETRPAGIDLHVHYDPRDERTAIAAINLAKGNDLTAISLLARSEVSPHFREFISYGEKVGVNVIPGVEHLVMDGKTPVNFICLGFDYMSKPIVDYFRGEFAISNSAKLAKFQMEFLKRKGFSLDDLNSEQSVLLDQLLDGHITEKAINFCILISSLPKNKFLIENLKKESKQDWEFISNRYINMEGYQDNPNKLDAKFLWKIFFDVGKEGCPIVSKNSKKVIDIIHKGGGVVLYSPEGSFDNNLWNTLIADDIDGIMAWHAGHLGSSDDHGDIPKDVIKECISSNRLVMGGSDYQQKNWNIGNGNGHLYINARRFEELKKYIKNKNGGNLPWVK